MRRDERAYLRDIIVSCDAIALAVHSLDFAAYEQSRLVRSSVEREFIIIGEAMTILCRIAPGTFEAVTKARRIIAFRNKLAHEYSMVDDEFVWAVAEHDVRVLRRECEALLQNAEAAGGEA